MSWLDDVPVERKLRLAMLITSTLALVVACGVFIAVEYVGYRRNIAHTVATLARLTANNSTAAIAFSDKPAAQQALDSLRAEPQIVGAALYDDHGEIFAQYSVSDSVLPTTLPVTTPAQTIFARGHVDGTYPVIEGERRLGTLRLRATLEQMYARMEVYVIVVLGVMVSAFVVAWLVASSLQRTVSRPILELARTASAVANGPDYSLRARLYGRDELGQLTTAFNTMLERTQASVEKVAQARDQAVAASRAKDEFLAALSHELRTPLNPVLMLASDAAGNPELPPTVRDDFAKIAKHVTLEARLIDDLLDLTRITRGKLSLDLQTCDVHAILRDALATVRPEIEEKKIAVSCEFAATESFVRADVVRLQQVFWNVLKNAVKFTDANGRITAMTRSSPETGMITIIIADTGIGMTEAEIGRAFEAFSQGDHGADGGRHRFGGLGLGLAITRTLMEFHGGTISATSAGRDKGSTFVMELPLQKVPKVVTELGRVADGEPAATSRGEAASARVNGASEETRKTRVLVVEDHAATRTTLSHLLTRRRFDVVTAATLTEARTATATRHFDLIVSDIGLPDGSGYTLMSELRAKYPELPGVALSGYGMEEDVIRSQTAGFNAHLTKPIDVKALDEVIAKLLVRKTGHS
jgi:signal transduction histidine kinase/ActR/RegA family two-component response regulator